MELVLWLLAAQGIMGAFDLVYHHEMTEKLTWKPAAANEMLLHGIRNGLYAVVFASLGFLHWHGALMWAFAAIVALEVLITLTDFVIEDRTRKLPATERVTHTLLALNYGAVLGLLIPEFAAWQAQPTAFVPVWYGFPSFIMGVYALGVLAWFVRDTFRAVRLRRMAQAGESLVTDAALAGKRVLVTGGTGFIGHALCRGLVASGARVTVLTRDFPRAAALLGGRVTFIDSLARLTPDDAFDAVINLSGEKIAQRWTVAARRKIIDSRVGLTRDLAAFMAAAQVKPAVFISGSAMGWYGTSDDSIFDESSAPATGGPGAFARELCHNWEEAAKGAARLGIRTVLLRTGLVLEKDGGTLAELLFPFDFYIGGPLGRGTQWFSWIHRDDLIGLIYHAIKNETVSGALNGTAPEPVTNAAFSAALGRAMRRPSRLPLPAFVLRLVFGDMADEIMLNGQRVVPARALATGYAFQYPGIDACMAKIFAL